MDIFFPFLSGVANDLLFFRFLWMLFSPSSVEGEAIFFYIFTLIVPAFSWDFFLPGEVGLFLPSEMSLPFF